MLGQKQLSEDLIATEYLIVCELGANYRIYVAFKERMHVSKIKHLTFCYYTIKIYFTYCYLLLYNEDSMLLSFLGNQDV